LRISALQGNAAAASRKILKSQHATQYTIYNHYNADFGEIPLAAGKRTEASRKIPKIQLATQFTMYHDEGPDF